MKALKSSEPKPFNAFRDNYLAAVMMVAALLITSLVSAQADSVKYSRINGYGFGYKRFVIDSILMVPLSSSPHVPYRAGGIRYRASDSTLQLWTGHQWNSIITGGTGIDTAYAYDDSTLAIETPSEDYFITIRGKPWAIQINDSTFYVGDDTITIRGTGSGSGADSSIFATKYGVDTAKANIRTQIDGKQPTGNYITALTGPVTANGPGAAATSITNNAITDAMIRQSAGLSMIGRSANSTGNIADITAGTDHQVLRRSGTTLGFGAVNLASSNAVTGTLPIGNTDTTTIKHITSRRTGVLPTGYAGGSVIVDTAGRIKYADAVRNNLVSFNNVTDTNAFGRPAAHFFKTKQQSLVAAHNESLNLGRGSFSIGAWVKFDSIGGLPQVIMCKDDNRTKRGSEYYLGYYQDYNTGPYNGMVFQVEESGHMAENDLSTWYVLSTAPALSANQWYFVVGRYDAVSGEVKISVNGTVDSAAAPVGGANITQTPFTIGSVVDDYDSTGLPEPASYMNGTIASAFAFQRLLTDAEITTLYNNTEAQLDPPGVNPGTMQNGPTFSADVPAALSDFVNSVNYDGVNDKTAMSSGISVNAGASSISMWFKATSLGGMLIGHSGSSNAYVRVLNSTTIRVQTNVTGTFVDYTVPTMSTGTWYNLIVVRGASNLTHVYLNGSESSTGGVSQTDDLTLDQVGLYWDGTNAGLNWEGKICDVRIYHSVLSGGDISNLQSNSATSAVPSLWYKLNEGSGTTNIDYGSAPVPHPLWYDELPVAMKYESPKTFVSWWDLSEPYGVRYDARLRNTGGLRDSAVSNLWVDISKHDQSIYGSTIGGGNLNLISTTHPTSKGKVIIDNAMAIDAVNQRIGLGTTSPDFDIVVKNNVGNGGELVFKNVSDVNVLRFGVDGTANTNLTAYGSVNITSSNSNSISLIPATGVTIGPARATSYRLDVLEDRTGLTDTTRAIYSYMTNSTFNTTSRVIRATALAGIANGTRSSGSNDLINIGVYGKAENGQQNYAGFFDGKVIIKTIDSTSTPANMLYQDPNTGEVKKAAVPAGAGVTLASGTYTPTLTNEANITTSTAYQCQYFRVGNIVTVSGKVTIDYTSTGATSMGISLPIASDIANDNEVAGTCNAEVNNGGVIRGDATNNRAQFYIITGSSAGYDYFFTFTYQIL